MRNPFYPARTRDEIATDNHDELAAWLDERTADLIARGVPPEAARRRASAEFGDAATSTRYATRQDVAADRRVRLSLWFEALVSDLRIAVRTVARTPVVTAVLLLTFALGIGATTAVFSVVHAMLIRPLPYAAERALVQLQTVENGTVRPAARFGFSTLTALRDRTTSFTGITGVEGYNAILSDEPGPEQLDAAALTPEGFEVLSAGAALGRTFGRADEASPNRVVVLLDGLWRRRFGADPSIVGRSIVLGGTPRDVIGVMPPDFRVPTYESSEFITLRDISAVVRHPGVAHVRVARLFARLRPGVTPEAAQADVDRVMRALQGENPRAFAGIEARVVPIRTAVAGDARPRLLVLMGAAAFVLAIACANVAGVLLSRATARRHELSVRVALGAGRRRLIRQFLAEGAILASAGGALGLLFAQLGIVALRQLAGTALPAGTAFALAPQVLSLGIATVVATAVLATLVPALATTRTLTTALRRDDHRTSPSAGSRRLRLTLVATQMAVAVVLLVGAGLLLRTLQRLSALDLGYATDHAVTFKVAFERPRSDAEQDVLWATLYDQLRAIPDVSSVGGGNVPTTGQSTVSGLEIEGRTVDRERLPDARYTPVSDDYFRTLRVPILRGRAFTDADRAGAPAVAIVSEMLAKQLWPGGDPLGALVKPGREKPWATIVGIAGDVQMGGADPPRPSVYTSQRQDHWPGGGSVVVRVEGNPANVMSAIRAVVRRVDPALPVVGLRTLDDVRHNTPAIAERRMQMQLLLTFAIVALIVSAIGVYGVGANAIEARRREFGIRMALGASRRRVLTLALRDGTVVAAAGALAGVPVAWLLASRLRGMLYDVTPFDPLTAVLVLTLLTTVALVASLVPARRATRIDPAQTMRIE